MFQDTIFAIATSPGRAGVAVMRISGPQAGSVAALLHTGPIPAPRTATLRKLYTVQGEIIDHALLLWFPAPASFTGEDVLELHLHGSRAVTQELLHLLAGQPGFRLAEPGEFTRRAFIHGKMDLTAAEGLADLIDAETSAQKKQAMRQMSGALESFYGSVRRDIVHALALCEAYIDFPDEDIPEQVLNDLGLLVTAIDQRIASILQDGERGEKIREGLLIVILGAPNAGKSSLMNVLAQKDVAIVSSRAGTTRDVLEAHLDLGGYAVTLVDTAGLRESHDEIEEEGVRRALAKARQADIKLVLFDIGHLPELPSLEDIIIDENTIVIFSKCDTRPEWSLKDIEHRFPGIVKSCPILLSSQNKEGVDELLDRLKTHIANLFSVQEAPYITRARHRNALIETQGHLRQFTKAQALELQCEELRRAANAISKVTGKIDVEQVLDEIFLNFCIGK